MIIRNHSISFNGSIFGLRMMLSTHIGFLCLFYANLSDNDNDICSYKIQYTRIMNKKCEQQVTFILYILSRNLSPYLKSLLNNRFRKPNTPMQYTAIFHGCINVHFQMKFFNIFLIFAQNIDCGYTFESPY